MLTVGAVLASVPAKAAKSAPSGVPSGAVASVGGALVTRASFDHWFAIAGYDQLGRRWRARDLRPPRFAGCVAKARKAQRSAVRRRTHASLRRRCRRDYERLRDPVLRFLIFGRWVEGEASERGVALTESEIDDAFEEAKRGAFASEREFRAFLRQRGMTYADARFQVAQTTLYLKLRDAASATAAPVTDRDVETYYELNRDEFALPEQRDLRLVWTRTRRAAVAARSALRRGQRWRDVARRHSIDTPSRKSGGKLTGIAPGTFEEEVDKAVFGAPRGELRGPVKGRSGYFVFKVMWIAPARQETLAEVSSAIRIRLVAEREEAAAEAFDTALRAKWKARTTCRRGFVVDMCTGTPEPGGPAAVR